jgi:translation initiation factor 3 subunit L
MGPALSDVAEFCCHPDSGSGSGHSGTWTVATDLEFHIDVDPESGHEMVMVSDTQQVTTYAPFLAHHITRFEEIIRDLSQPPPVPAAAAAVRA